jgi:O-antigen/teichoic acid export membrane protein
MEEVSNKRGVSLLNKLIKQQGRRQKAILNIIYSFGYKGISILIGFAYMPLLLDYLNQEKYGVWLTLTSILGWFSFFDIGLGNGLRNKLTIALANKDFKQGKTYVSTTYALLSLIFGGLLIIFNLLNYFIPWTKILNTTSFKFIDLYWLTSIVFSLFLIRFVVQLISVIYFANQKPSLVDLMNTLGQVFSFILVFFLVKLTTESDILLFGFVISFIPLFVLLIFSFVSFNGKYKFIAPSLSAVDFKYNNELFSLGAKFFFLQICSIIVFSTSNFFIAQFYGSQEVAVYNVAYKYFQMPIMIYAIIASPIWSAITDAYAKDDNIWLRKTINRMNFVSILFIVGIIIMLLCSNWIFSIWLGNRIYVPFSLSLTLAIFTSIQIIFTPYSLFVNATGKIKLSMYMTSLSMVLYFSSIYLFGNMFSNSTGIVLASISTVFAGLFIPWQTYKILNGTAKGIWNK